ncbi:hypothetical protein [Aeoliella sp. SH292]|uniref:hypothetical protein n=1 Tax=Aeoliella sp. SH292 TaxID=3454464 RepID=UPI003F9A3377
MKLQGSQRLASLIATVLIWSHFQLADAASVASSPNFTVMAPNARLADMVVAHAEQFRTRFAAAWLGGNLPATRTPAAIYVEIDPKKSFARALVGDADGGHMVWLVGSEEAVTKHLLEHELTHVLLAARFGDSMPIWANEGIASQYDNPRRHELRRQKLNGFVEIDSWPHLDRLMTDEIRQPWQYAAAVSLTEYLVARGGTQKFLAFVDDSRQDVVKALDTHYGIRSLSELEHDWHAHVSVESSRALPVAIARTTDSERFVR